MKDLHEKWPHRWLNQKIEGKKSNIDKIGIFAKEKINEGEVVTVLGGVIVPAGEVDEYKEIMGQVGVQIDKEFFIVPTTREELERTGAVNHSCAPNIGFDGSIIIRAIRDIEEGEECVIDYAFAYLNLDEFDCKCGTGQCRKKITGLDWQNRQLQEKYPNYFADFIKKKIKEAHMSKNFIP